jgi:hypothetical protein
MCSSWDSLHACASESLLEKMYIKETVLDKVPENACVFGTRTGYRGRVYCTGLLRTGLLSSYVSRKEVCGSWEYSTTVLRVRVCPKRTGLSYVSRTELRG